MCQESQAPHYIMLIFKIDRCSHERYVLVGINLNVCLNKLVMFGPYLRKKVVLSHNRSNMLCMLITNKLRQQRSMYIDVKLKCTDMALISRNGKRTYVRTQIQNNVIKYYIILCHIQVLHYLLNIYYENYEAHLQYFFK